MTPDRPGEEAPVDRMIRRQRRQRLQDWIIVGIAFCIAVAAGLARRHGLF